MTTIKSLPRLTLELDGLPLAPVYSEALQRAEIRQRLSAPAACHLEFASPALDSAAIASIKAGSRIRLGLAGRQQPLFEGRITRLQQAWSAGQPRLRLRAHDALYALSRRQPVRSHVQATVVEIAAGMVADLGLRVTADHGGPVWAHRLQSELSDLDFLRQLGEACGLYFILRGNALRFFDLAEESPVQPLALDSSLWEICLNNDLDNALETVAVTGWDPGRGVASEARSEGAAMPLTDPAADLGLQQTLCDRSQHSDSQLEAKARAQALWSAAAQHSIAGVTAGNPDLRVGDRVRIEGAGFPQARAYLLTELSHCFDPRRGFSSRFNSRPPPLRPEPAAGRMSLGLVTQVDDPQRWGRVKVSLPCYGDLESEWLEVVQIGAGENKGLLALPDIGDRVVVLMPQQNPAQAVVIGGLYGERQPPEETVDADRVFRYCFRTPQGQRVRLDDTQGSITLENRSGSRVQLTGKRIRVESASGHCLEMSDDLLRLHANSNLEIEAPGKTLTIGADKINFERRE